MSDVVGETPELLW